MSASLPGVVTIPRCLQLLSHWYFVPPVSLTATRAAWYSGDRLLPTVWGVLSKQDCSSSSSVRAPGHASHLLEPWPSQLLSESCTRYVRQTMLSSLPILLYNLSNQNPECFVSPFASLFTRVGVVTPQPSLGPHRSPQKPY